MRGDLDALILCGGFATRLEPITLFVPKPLLPVGGRPILDYIADSVEAIGVDRIILSTNKKFCDQFKYWAGNREASGSGKKIRIVVEPTMHDGEKFGAVKGINYTIESEGLKDDLLIVAGDNLFKFDLKRLEASFRRSRRPTIAVYDVKSTEDAKHFGVVEMEDGLIKGFEEKPQAPKTSLISTAVYLFPKEMTARFGEYVKDGRNLDAPGYFLQWLIKRERICGVVYSEDWHDIGTIDTYRKVFDSYLKS